MNQATAAASDAQALMRSIIQRVATGPELSKDISQEEARLAIRAVLQGHINPVQIGIFLIGLRMKRETDAEYLGLLEGIHDMTESVIAPVDEVLDLADPYDGYNRTLPAAPFLPALLAACGVPTVSHGMETASPKFGVTHRQILRAAGLRVDMPVAQAALRLGDAQIGWAYVDQEQFCPSLNGLMDFRTLMVKRSAITTVEVLTQPIRGQRRTHLVTGYVHKPYPRIYALLARHMGYNSALLVRGVEGAIIASLRQAAKFFQYHDLGAEQDLDFEPTTLGIQQEWRAPSLPASLIGDTDNPEQAALGVDRTAFAQAAAQAGRAALGGAPGMTRDALVYAAALCLWHLKRHATPQAAAEQVRTVLDSGAALARFQ